MPLGGTYAPPGVYTQTNFDTPVSGLASTSRIPVFIGTGSQILTQLSLELVRGSSGSTDTRVVDEDETGRAVASVSPSGQITLGAFNGQRDRIQVRNFPIVTGEGTGTPTTDLSSVSVTVNGQPIVVTQIQPDKGILKLASAPKAGDVVLVTYFFDRTDTRITDDLSDQVTPSAPVIFGGIGENFVILAGVNDTLQFLVDDTDVVNVVITPSPPGGWTSSQVSAFINSAATQSSLQAASATNNFGQVVVRLTASRDITIGSGTANSTLGFSEGAGTNRNKTFHSYQYPIVDGTDGGVATTDPSDVVVKVNGVQVIPTFVDGMTGQIILPFAPEFGAVITAEYWFNSWQNTFDYLANRGVLDVTLCGITPDRSDYVQGTDFILKDDRIVWGTAFLTSSGVHTSGTTFFDSVQISPVLVDMRQYLAPCVAVVDTSLNPPVASATRFVLPLQPTTGDGRDNPLGTSTFNKVANGRTDLPTNRPDLVWAYWGFTLQDALERGRVKVSKVDGRNNTITLVQPVPVGATVYATFYYNTITDQTYNLAVVSPGPSGVGTYTITDDNGVVLPSSVISSKSAGLATTELVFPSGSENTPDLRHEVPFTTSLFKGAVEEDVVVTFASQAATLAEYTVPSSGPYYAVTSTSDRFRLLVNGSDLVTSTSGINLTQPTGVLSGFFAQIVGNQINYSAPSGGSSLDVGIANNTLDMLVDGVLIQSTIDNNPTATVLDAVTAINRSASGENSTASALGTVSTIFLNASASSQDGFYIGYKIRITSGPAAGDSRIVTAYNGTTKTASVAPDFTAAPAAGNAYCITNPTTLPQYVAATRFNSSVVISAGDFDSLTFVVVGDVTGTNTYTATLTPGTYANASDLAAEVDAQMNAEVGADMFDVAANANGQLVIRFERDPTDTTAYVQFLTDGTPASDFTILAGISASASVNTRQMAIVHGPIARASRFTADGSPFRYDRLVLRNRITSGGVSFGSSDSIYPMSVSQQAQITVLGGTAASAFGLVPNETGLTGNTATIRPATLVSSLSLASGQNSVTGQPLVRFFGDASSDPPNRSFFFSVDGAAVSLEFMDASGNPIPSGVSVDVPLGPAGTANTVLNQIASAMASAGLGASAAAVLSAGYLKQEGVGIRITSLTSTPESRVTIGNGSANSTLGFTANDSATATPVQVEVLVSALMAQSGSSIPAYINAWTNPTLTYFARNALAKTVTDAVGSKYLYLQSQGTAGSGPASSLAFATATSASVTLPGVGLGIVSGDGNAGEPALTGFYVVSTDPVNGSGTANTSVLNSGAGQDGLVGQTYRDLVTGLTFTVLPRPGNVPYPSGQSFTIRTRNITTTNASRVLFTIPGIQLTVSNTSGIGVGDTALVETFKSTGAEPAVGDLYYVSYNYLKQDYSAQLFTRLSTVEASYGPNTPENPVTMAAYLAFLNGANVIGIQQVVQDEDQDNDGIPDAASESAYIAAIDALEGTLPGGLLPNILTLLKGDSLDLFQYLARSCDIQSSSRYRAERTAVCGVSSGTSPQTVTSYAKALKRTRFRLIYPDAAVLTVTRGDGRNQQYLIDGTLLAAMLVGSLVSPTTDVATPWTNRRLFGVDRLARKLDAPTQNQIAVNGVTILSDSDLVLVVRQGFTTDMTSLLTRTPTVVTIADEVQQQTRSTLDRFSGIKFLPGVLSQIEGQTSNTLKLLTQAQIITTYTGVRANVNDTDPTVAEVSAAYQPVFPLLYILVTYNLRSSL